MEKGADLNNMVRLLAEKVSLLTQKNQKLIDANRELNYKIDRLKQERAEQQQEVNVLTQDLEARHLATNFIESYGSKRTATKAVENILREIEDCIVLINK